MKTWIVVLLLGVAVPCLAESLASPEVKNLIAHEEALNDKCRGGSGDDAKTWQYCKERDRVDARIKSLGWCYGHEGQFGYQMHWERCQPQKKELRRN